MNSLGQDIRFSLRLMRKRPGMTFLVIAALVVGIGINSAVFTVVNSVVIRPLPLPDPGLLTTIMTRSQQFPNMPFSYPEFLDWKKQNHSFQSMATLRFMSANLTGNGTPEHLKGIRTSASFFKVLGLSPAMGRDFSEDDDRPGANRTIIISHGLWLRRFGADPAILGKLLVLNDQPYEVIGVAPANQFYIFAFDFWAPTQLFLDEGMMNRNNRYDLVIARLYPSVTPEQAQVEMETISHRLAGGYPQREKDLQGGA